ncbi:glycoside hydrolase family 13 protein [Streptomyces sp. NBC_01210]|uniref:glycoside hydrolase family 13 protein n=1 Tax=Streptomyces sp. NBC_01210 TaxID=2903774 RepID=UPI002E141039|nr:glycoside hydrolase family 13 protein [Streptomyces sp. NBC_01210]
MATGDAAGSGKQASEEAWWHDAVIYQVYLRSFADSDGDGVGDIPGLSSRLDNLTRLGVDGIWLSPCHPSPDLDHGYDVVDYTDIDARYGGMPAFQEFLDQAHARGLKVLMDIVPNHCSAAHPWFLKALAAPPGSPERERFIFRDGRGPDRSLPPNNWPGGFGGSAWTRVDDGQWYLHTFDPGQPDFNWRNPKVADHFDHVLRRWFDRGIDGFRIDVAHLLLKHPDLPDWPDLTMYNAHQQNQPGIHDVYRRWRRIADSYDRELTYVGEVWVPTVSDLAKYVQPDELHQAFYFDLLYSPWDAAAFREAVDRGLDGIASAGTIVSWTLGNHDVHRVVTRYGRVGPDTGAGGSPARSRGAVDVRLGEQRARAALLFLLALPGSIYLYQGEELGLPEVQDLPDHARQDPIWSRSGHTEHGRDGCRVPLPWRKTGSSFGFGAGGSWLPQPDWFGDYAVEQQWLDVDSTLWLYARALSNRRALRDRLAGEALEWMAVPDRPDVLVYRRGGVICVTTFGDAALDLPAGWGRVICSSAPVVDGRLPGAAAAWLLIG